MNTISCRHSRAALVLAALVAAAGVAFASGVPEPLAALKGKSDKNANDAFARAGYQFQGEKAQWDRRDSFWWSERARQCLRMTSRFGLITGVATVGEADCTNALPGGDGVAGRPGRLVAADLLGLARAGGEARLAAAGFNSVWMDDRPEAVQMLWFNQHTRQCISATVVGNSFTQARDEPTSQCR